MVDHAVNPESQPAGRVGLEEDEGGDAGTGAGAPEAADEHASEMMTAHTTPEVKVQSSSRPPTASSTAAESPPPSRGGGASQRNASSSKFASLRAAFEKTGASANGSAEGGVKKRVPSSSDLTVGKGRERNQEYEAEIARLKDELEEERKLRFAFEEKVSSLEEEMDKADAGVVKDELEKERELRVAFEDKVGSLEEAMDRAGGEVVKLSEELAVAVQNARKLEQLEDARAGGDGAGDHEEAEDETNDSHVEESAALRRQLSDLKRSITRSTKPIGQLTDTALRQEIGLLQHEVQNWIVNNFRKSKPEASPADLCARLDRIAEPEQVEHLRPLYEAFDASAKLAIYQATVAVYMMEIFDDRFLFGLRGQHDWAKRTRQAAETLPTALDTATYNRWRAVTFSALTQSVALKEPIESAAGGMAEMICITLNAVAEMEESEARLGSLTTIVKRAILLAHQVRSQQAQYDFVLPAPGEDFDVASMDDIVDDGEMDDGRVVRCATFCSLFKRVDDEGVELEPRKVVFRAKVLCQGDEEG